jgi:hypothetical protein
MWVAKSRSPRLNQPGPVGAQLGLDEMGLAGPPPALLLIDSAAERVHDGVEVRADVQAEQGDVISGVPDDCDVRLRRRDPQPSKEPGTADSSGEQRDPHAPSLPA